MGQLLIHLFCMVYIANLAKEIMGEEGVREVIEFEKDILGERGCAYVLLQQAVCSAAPHNFAFRAGSMPRVAAVTFFP